MRGELEPKFSQQLLTPPSFLLVSKVANECKPGAHHPSLGVNALCLGLHYEG